MVTTPLGWLIGGPAAAAAAVAMGLATTCFYEFCHCIQHLPFAPKTKFLRQMKKRHVAHHFHSEKGNFGITNFLWDRVFGTFYPDPKKFPGSKTVFNLGYAGVEIERYPWVARLSKPAAEKQSGAGENSHDHAGVRDGRAIDADL